jgi:hypothetical protein
VAGVEVSFATTHWGPARLPSDAAAKQRHRGRGAPIHFELMPDRAIFLPVAERMEEAMRVAVGVAASLALSACATHPQVSSALDSNLDAMIGQPVEAAVARLGQPMAAVPVGADLVYGWGHAFTKTEFTNAAAGWVDAASSQGGVFPAPRRTVPDSCVIRVVVGPNGLIRDWDYQGNARGCRSYGDSVAGQAMTRAG